MVSNEKPIFIQIVVPYRFCVFSDYAFNNFPPLTLHSLIMMCVGMDFSLRSFWFAECISFLWLPLKKKWPQIQWFKTTGTYFLMALEAKSLRFSRSAHPSGLHSLACRCITPFYASTFTLPFSLEVPLLVFQAHLSLDSGPIWIPQDGIVISKSLT